MYQPRVKVLEEVHVAGVEAGVVIEVVGGGERDIRQLHGSVQHAPSRRNPVTPRTELSDFFQEPKEQTGSRT